MKQENSSGRTRNSGSRAPAPRRKKSGRVIAVLLFLIVAAAIVLAAVWFGVLRPAMSGGAQESISAEVPAEPAPVQTSEPTPEPTLEPTPEPTPEPVRETHYTSAYTPLGSGMILSGEYDGTFFRESTRITDANGNDLSVSEDGTQVGNVSVSGYVTNLLRLSDGRIAAVSWVENAQKLSIFNAASDAVEETIDLSSSALCFADGAGDYSFYYSTGDSLFGYKMAEKTEELIFNWLDADVSGSRVSNIVTEDGKSFRCLVNSWSDAQSGYETSLVTVTAQEGTAQNKTELVMVSANPVDTLQDAVVAFNRSSETAHITLKTISVADGANPVAEIRQLAQQSGKMPDLIDLTSMPYEALAASGMLEDLTPYLENDGELNLNSLVPQVLSALQFNGKLYGTAEGFSLATVVGPARLLDGMEGWTFQQYNNIVSTMGEGMYAFGAADTRSSILYEVLGMNLNRFVDWNNLTCTFNTAEFARILEFAKRLPAEPRDTNDAELIQKKVQLLQRTALYSAGDASKATAAFTDPVIIGLPVIEGPGNVLNLRKGFAMGSDCADKDAAWQFIRSGILSSAQNSSWPFPSNQNAFENALAVAGEQAELVRLILSHAAPNAENDLIYNLVLENAADYFAGNGNSGEAAQRVQDAVVSYLATIKS